MKINRRELFESIGGVFAGLSLVSTLKAESISSDVVVLEKDTRVIANGLENKNDRIYSKEIWKKIIVDFHTKPHQDLIFFGLESDLMNVAARLQDIYLDPVTGPELFKVYVKIKAINTPYGKIVQEMSNNKQKLFLTPNGNGILKNKQIQNYTFTHWSLVSESSFLCAEAIYLV